MRCYGSEIQFRNPTHCESRQARNNLSVDFGKVYQDRDLPLSAVDFCS
jgi:hypothetical protein